MSINFSRFFSGLFSKHRTPTPAPVPAPTFFDDFTHGLDNWIVSTWTAPQNGMFNSNNVELVPDGLCLKLIQTTFANGTVQSIGGEVATKQRFGYGTYEWVMKAGAPVLSGAISALFVFYNNSETEIDFEIEGQHPDILHCTQYTSVANSQTMQQLLGFDPSAAFHTYRFVWAPGKVSYYVDGNLLFSLSTSVPSAAANVMMNHWGTNNPNWGGLATPNGVERLMYVRSFKFTPA